MIVAHKTKSTETLIRSLIVVFAVALASLLSGCQTLTDTTVKSKSAANEAAAIGALRTVSSAQMQYSVSHDGEYATFDELVKAGNLDVRFSGDRPVLGGYVLIMKVSAKDSSNPGSYSINADPQQDVAAASTGVRHLYMESTDNAIHVNAKQSATSTDPQM